MKRILIIDDDVVMRAIIKEALEEDGYEPEEATNGKEGLALHSVNPFELIITDIIMPDMEGLETIRAVKRINADTRLIAISGGGYNEAGDYLSMAKKMGAHYILAKPFNKKDLSIAVKELLKE